jgi:hypothetical protein
VRAPDGSAAQVAALQEGEEFRRMIVDASMIVKGLNVIAGRRRRVGARRVAARSATKPSAP